MRLFAIILVVIVVLPFTAEAQNQIAPPGYHYEPGSSTLSTTASLYLHIVPALQSEAADRLDQAIGNAARRS